MGFRTPERPRESHILFPTLLDDAVALDHNVRAFHAIVSHPVFEATFRGWAKDYVLVEGQPPYHPRDLAALFLYGMVVGIRSSRALESACEDRVDVIWLLQGQHPDHSTIAGFVKKRSMVLNELFRNTLRVAVGAGLIKLSHVAIDGTKLEANASKGSVKRDVDLRKLEVELDAVVKKFDDEWKANEEKDGTLFVDSEGSASHRNPSEERRRAAEKRARVRAALDAIRRRDEESGPNGEVKPVGSTTDPDARHMKDKEHQVRPSYNLQMAVDSEAELIVAHEISDAAADSGKLLPIVNQIEENVGFSPKEVSADKAYHVGSDLENLEKRKVVTYIPEQGRGQAQTPEQHAAVAAAHNGEILTDEQWKALPTAANKKISRDAFIFNAKADTYTCPMGQLLTVGKVLVQQGKSGKTERTEYRVEEGACVGCPHAALCCENPEKGRMVTRDQYEPSREKLRQRMATEEGREKYKQRMHLAETPNAVIKGAMGIYRFLRRGFTQVRAEASIMMAAYNIRILMKHHVKATVVAALATTSIPGLDSG